MPKSTPLSPHLNARGDVHMVGVGHKGATERRAVARAVVRMGRVTADRLRKGDAPKGDVLAAARIAGIVAAKRTSDLIPLCHPIALTEVDVSIQLRPDGAWIDVTTAACDRTGVEMEAMTAASVAALTLYDMLKGIDRGISFSVQLLEKRGGKSGVYRARRGVSEG